MLLGTRLLRTIGSDARKDAVHMHVSTCSPSIDLFSLAFMYVSRPTKLAKCTNTDRCLYASGLAPLCQVWGGGLGNHGRKDVCAGDQAMSSGTSWLPATRTELNRSAFDLRATKHLARPNLRNDSSRLGLRFGFWVPRTPQVRSQVTTSESGRCCTGLLDRPPWWPRQRPSGFGSWDREQNHFP